jgi:predicted flap endonuclease-1-like 5' DNA nuclease
MKEAPKKEETPPIMETPVAIELTQVKGIKTKRAEQLKTLGINNAHDLANASANELAAKLKIASYFTEQWIENAKKLTGKS